MSDELAQRHSKALEAELITDPVAKAEAEALNGLRQYDYGLEVIQQALERKSFKLRVSLVLSLQRHPTIPEQIVSNRNPYFDALDAADAACKEGTLDLSAMENLLGGMLAVQLKGVYDAASGS